MATSSGGAGAPVQPRASSIPTAFPGLFGPSTFASPPLFASSRETSGVHAGGGSPGEPVAFTADDRVLLKMVYHQQQAIHVQLETLTTWMQHFGSVLARLDRSTREPQPQPQPQPLNTTEASGRQSQSAGALQAAVPSNDTSSLDRVPGECHPPPRHESAATPPSATTSTRNHREDEEPSRNSQPQQPQPQQRLRPHEANQASTPPGGEYTAAASGMSALDRTSLSQNAGSAANRSIESVGAVWDPTNHRPSQPNNSTSSRSSRGGHSGSQMGRRENPLLAAVSLGASSGLGQRVAAVSASRVGSGESSGSAADVSGLSSRYFRDDPGRVRSQPVIARPRSSSSSAPGGTSTAPYASLTRALGEGDIPAFRTVGKARPASGSGSGDGGGTVAVDPGAISALLHRGGRTGPKGPAGVARQQQPQQQQRTPVSTAGDRASGGRSSAAHSPVLQSEKRPPEEGDGGGHSARHSARPTPPHHYHHHEAAALHRVDMEFETDSLSDGYGSYDSRQYMKSVGLL